MSDKEVVSERKWKRPFLSSGVPLEHEVAMLLCEHNFSVSPEFEYLRKTPDGKKEFSVDLSATYYQESNDGIMYSVNTLIECKYRTKEKIVVLFPDPNRQPFSSTLGGTIQAIDEFSPFHLFGDPICKFEEKFPFVYKGVEIHDGGAVEKDLKHGISQLKYAAPSFYLDLLVRSLFSHPEDQHPIFASRLLVTNAQLRVINEGVGLGEIEAADELSSISEPVPAAIMVSSGGPDFMEHFRSVASEYEKDNILAAAEELSAALDFQGKLMKFQLDDPREFMLEILNGRYPAYYFYSQVFIVQLDSLDLFLRNLKQSCSESYRRKRKNGKWKEVNRRQP